MVCTRADSKDSIVDRGASEGPTVGVLALDVNFIRMRLDSTYFKMDGGLVELIPGCPTF